jgi:hypothetical protein
LCEVSAPAAATARAAAAPASQTQLVHGDADKVHMHFLRMLTGVGKACIDVVLRDMHRAPIMHHWVVLAARWWNKLAGMDAAVARVARAAWLSDIALMRGSETGGRLHKACWSYKLLSSLQGLGVITAEQWDTAADLTQLTFDEGVVRKRLSEWLRARWAPVPRGDPRAATADVDMVTHANWVYRSSAYVDYTDRRTAPPHMKLRMAPRYLRVLARMRCGAARLEVQTGRWQQGVPRDQRVCQVCQGEDATLAWRQEARARCCPAWDPAEGGRPPVVEDVRHMLLECPAYDAIRARYELLPAQPWRAARPCETLRALFGHHDQPQVARMIYEMHEERARLLGLSWW